MRLLSLVLVVCMSVLAAGAAQIQDLQSTAVTGKVVDASGASVPGAEVKLTAPTFPMRSVVTDSNGEFRFADVPAGSYLIEVSLAGFVTLQHAVTVAVGSPKPLTLTLSVAALTEIVTVTSEAATLQMSTSSHFSAHRSRQELTPLVSAPDFNTEAYDRIEDNSFRATRVDPLSTFSIDVDTASYANVRRFLNDGRMPPADAVRVEEMINYFRFDYPQPSKGTPFSVTTEVTGCPWDPRHRLALIGLQAQPIDRRELRRNLVFLIDVSGSMEPPDKLPLVRRAMRMLVDTLTARDRIAIVVYAGASGLVLPATAGDQKDRIHQAIARLEAGGSTNGAEGITLAYKVAQNQFITGGVNRVILATDGDFNVGVTNVGDLTRLVEEKREAGIFLSVLGVGTGNLKDAMMEKLADTGNGNYSYLDSLHEARKVLVAEAGATLVTVAKDVKLQVEFNPAHVAAYRLIGYENRLLRNEDFNNDLKDAGEIGAGHTVTALYEIVPPGVPFRLPGVDPLRYQQPAESAPQLASSDASKELMTVKLRYKEPDGNASQLLTFPVVNRTTALSDNTGFASAVAEFGMLLRRSEHKGSATYRDAAALATKYRGRDGSGYRAEFVRLVELAEALSRQTRVDTDNR